MALAVLNSEGGIMAQFAELDVNNTVIRVVTVSDMVMKDVNGVLQEELGIAFCHNLYDGIWKETRTDGTLRKNFASVGYTYDLNRDAFISPKPFASWVLDETTCRWKPPIPYPLEKNQFIWDEETKSWIIKKA